MYVRTLNPVFKCMMVFIFISCQSAGTKTHLWSFPHQYFLYYQHWASPKCLHHWSWNFFCDMVQRSIWDFKNVLSYCPLSYLVTHRRASHPWDIEDYSLQRMNVWPLTALRVAAIRKVSKEPSSSTVWGRWCIQVFTCFDHLKRDATMPSQKKLKAERLLGSGKS